MRWRTVKSRDYNGGSRRDYSAGRGTANYRDLRERTKRQEDRREESLKRIVELHRVRYLHLFPSQMLGDSAGDAAVEA
jgi:hypothetical protein